MCAYVLYVHYNVNCVVLFTFLFFLYMMMIINPPDIREKKKAKMFAIRCFCTILIFVCNNTN